MKIRIPILLLAGVLLVYAAVLLFDVAPAEAPSPLPVLDSSRRAGRRPYDAKDPLPAAPEATPQDLRAVTEALALINRAAESRRGGCGNLYFGGGRFLIERDMHYREWRLLAQGYPAAAERVAEDLIRNRTSSREWHAASAMLSELARRGGRRAEQLLLRTAVSPALGAAESQVPLHFLSAADPDRLYQETYRKQWSFGHLWACGLLDYLVDPMAVELLRKISTNPAEPDYLRRDVDKALARLRILEGAGLKERLTAILEQTPAREHREEESRRQEECRWALEIAKARRLDLRDALRRRLNRNLAAAEGESGDVESFAKDYRVNVHVFPRDWDNVLVTYVELGGTPNALERDRLREFGYLCDPKERLDELLRALR